MSEIKPKKVKLHHERTRAADRTRKDKRGRKGSQPSDFAGVLTGPLDSGLKPNHEARMFSRDALNGIFTKTDIFLPILPVQGEEEGQTGVVVGEGPKPRWMRRLKTVVNPAFAYRRKV